MGWVPPKGNNLWLPSKIGRKYKSTVIQVDDMYEGCKIDESQFEVTIEFCTGFIQVMITKLKAITCFKSTLTQAFLPVSKKLKTGKT